jgi:hypothetical protein
VRSPPEIVLGRNGSAALAPPPIVRHPRHRRDDAPFPESAVEDHLDVDVAHETLLEIHVKPRMLSRNDEEVPYHDRIFSVATPQILRKYADIHAMRQGRMHDDFFGSDRGVV